MGVEVGMMAAGMLAGELMKPKAPAIAPPPAPIAPPQASKMPDMGVLMNQIKAGNSAGAGSTFLTGPNGVDPNTMKMGKTTLLGS